MPSCCGTQTELDIPPGATANDDYFFFFSFVPG